MRPAAKAYLVSWEKKKMNREPLLPQGQCLRTEETHTHTQLHKQFPASSLMLGSLSGKEDKFPFHFCWHNLSGWEYASLHQLFTCPFHSSDTGDKTSINNNISLCSGVPEHIICLHLETAMSKVPATRSNSPGRVK